MRIECKEHLQGGRENSKWDRKRKGGKKSLRACERNIHSIFLVQKSLQIFATCSFATFPSSFPRCTILLSLLKFLSLPSLSIIRPEKCSSSLYVFFEHFYKLH